MVFAAASATDTALGIARSVAARYPATSTQFVISEQKALNPQVNNIRAAVEAASHDLVLHSDANIRLGESTLASLVQEFLDEGEGILSCPIVGSGERCFWAAVENVQLTAFITPAMCFANNVAHLPLVVGKVMMFRRTDLRQLHAFAMVGDRLAHDYYIGLLYARSGRKVVVSRHVVMNVNTTRTASEFFERHVRWLQMRILVRPDGWLADLGGDPPFWAALAAFASGGQLLRVSLLAGIWTVKVAVDRKTTVRLRGYPIRPCAAFVVRDIALPAAAMVALFKRTIDWRGNRLYISRGSRLRPR